MRKGFLFAFLVVVASWPTHVQEKVNDRGLYDILEPNTDWALLGQGYQLTADSAVDKDGNVFFTDCTSRMAPGCIAGM
jgi:hypothetical protein